LDGALDLDPVRVPALIDEPAQVVLLPRVLEVRRAADREPKPWLSLEQREQGVEEEALALRAREPPEHADDDRVAFRDARERSLQKLRAHPVRHELRLAVEAPERRRRRGR